MIDRSRLFFSKRLAQRPCGRTVMAAAAYNRSWLTGRACPSGVYELAVSECPASQTSVASTNCFFQQANRRLFSLQTVRGGPSQSELFGGIVAAAWGLSRTGLMGTRCPIVSTEACHGEGGARGCPPDRVGEVLRRCRDSRGSRGILGGADGLHAKKRAAEGTHRDPGPGGMPSCSFGHGPLAPPWSAHSTLLDPDGGTQQPLDLRADSCQR
jgi:hypothetical protein